MGKGFKAGGKDWKPGESGNPNGRPKVPSDVKQARKLNKVKVERILNRFLAMDRQELERIKTDPSTPILDLFVAGLVAKGVSQGDHKRLEFIFDRLVGKVTEKVHHSVSRPNASPEEIEKELKAVDEQLASLEKDQSTKDKAALPKKRETEGEG